MPESEINCYEISRQLRKGEDFGDVLADVLNRYDFLGFSKAVGAKRNRSRL